MEKPWIKKTFLGKISKILEYNQVHYFFWPIEFGIDPSGIRIGEISIPIFPKFNDYEPLKVTKYRGNTVVLSRFHYRLLTYFNKPYIKDGRTIVKFIFGSHTPIPFIDIDSPLHFGYNCRFPMNVDSREISKFRKIRGYFAKFCEGKITYSKEELIDLVDYEVSSGIPPEDVIFMPENMIAIVCLGTYPSLEELKEIGYRK